VNPRKDPLLETLAQVCKKHPTDRKYLLLQNLSHGVAAVERLARGGAAWANLLPMPPVALAKQVLASAGPGLAQLPPGIELALMSQILSQVPAKSRLHPLAGTPGVAPALWRTICDLRMADLFAKDLKNADFLSVTRASELKGLLAAYEDLLAKQGWADDADILRRASKLGKAWKGAADWILLLPEGAVWSRLETQFLDSLAAKRIPVPLSISPVEPLSAEGRPPFELFQAISQDAESREIVRRFLTEKIAFDEVELACAGAEFDRAVLWDLFERLQIPCTLAEGLPVTVTRPGKAVLGYLHWIETGFEVGPLVRLLRAGVLKMSAGGEELSGNKVAKSLERFSSYRGLASYVRVLDAHELELEAEIKRLKQDESDEEVIRAQTRLDRFETVRKALQLFITNSEWAAASGTISLQAAVAGCRAFLEGHAAARKESPIERAALETLQASLRALAQAGDRQVALAVACAFIKEALLGLSVGGGRSRPGHVHITSLENAGWEGRRHVFLTGLTMSAFPGRATQDPFLLDEERENLKAGLETSAEKHSRKRRAVYERLSVLSGPMVFSAATHDSSDGRESSPSSLFLEALRCKTGNHALTYGDVSKAVGETVGLAPSNGGLAADDLSWWLRDGVTLAEVEKAFPMAKRGRLAVEARQKSDWSVYDGSVPSAAGKFDPTTGTTPVSSGFMGELAQCPFRFFLKRVLRIRSKEEEERDPLEWLNRLERGQLLHEVYSRFLRELRAKKETPNPKTHGKRLTAIVKEEIASRRAVLPPLFEGTFAQEESALLRDAELFLENVAKDWPSASPIGFEVSFGMPEDGGHEELASAEPVSVEFGAGNKFLIRGRVDRIDRVDGNVFEVVDYKTGRYSPKKAAVYLPKEIQPMFYLKAVEALLQKRFPGASVSGFTFLYSSLLGEWNKVRRSATLVTTINGMMTHLLTLLRKGVFVQAWKKEECQYCNYKAICGDEPSKRANHLLEGEDPQLASARLLRDYE
jgi:RecB family exonuclease